MELKDIAKLFGSKVDPLRLPGGQGTSYRSGQIVLKPIYSKAESKELAELVRSVSSSDKLRIPQPLKSVNDIWVEEGYAAWEFLEGQEVSGKYDEKVKVCDWFSEIFENAQKPKFLEAQEDAWHMADRITWEEVKKQYNGKFQGVIDTVRGQIKPIKLPFQIIHGDISTNIIFSEDLPPAVIDITIYWRPRDFAKALLIVDEITWEGAGIETYDLIKDLPEIDQLLLRAGLRRIIANAEHVGHKNKDIQTALSESNKYLETLKLLNLL